MAGLPRELSAARTRFERWRETRESRAIPEELWSTAVELSEEHGIHRTSRALRLNYYSLKKRVAASEVPVAEQALAGKATEPPVFVDVVPDFGMDPSVGGAAELQDGRGSRMRIEWRGCSSPDLAAAASAFFGGPS